MAYWRGWTFHRGSITRGILKFGNHAVFQMPKASTCLCSRHDGLPCFWRNISSTERAREWLLGDAAPPHRYDLVDFLYDIWKQPRCRLHDRLPTWSSRYHSASSQMCILHQLRKIYSWSLLHLCFSLVLDKALCLALNSVLRLDRWLPSQRLLVFYENQRCDVKCSLVLARLLVLPLYLDGPPQT